MENIKYSNRLIFYVISRYFETTKMSPVIKYVIRKRKRFFIEGIKSVKFNIKRYEYLNDFNDYYYFSLEKPDDYERLKLVFLEMFPYFNVTHIHKNIKKYIFNLFIKCIDTAQKRSWMSNITDEMIIVFKDIFSMKDKVWKNLIQDFFKDKKKEIEFFKDYNDIFSSLFDYNKNSKNNSIFLMCHIGKICDDFINYFMLGNYCNVTNIISLPMKFNMDYILIQPYYQILLNYFPEEITILILNNIDIFEDIRENKANNNIIIRSNVCGICIKNFSGSVIEGKPYQHHSFNKSKCIHSNICRNCWKEIKLSIGYACPFCNRDVSDWMTSEIRIHNF
jgi:hypothetical protein